MSKRNENLVAKEIQMMIELGLWPENIPHPNPTTLERIHRLDLDIRQRKRKLFLPEKNAKQIFRRARAQYRKSSREKRDEFQQSISDKKEKRRQYWRDYSEFNFTHLGKGVSNWLNYKDSETTKLESTKLPVLMNATDLSAFLQIPIKTLTWMAYHRKVSKYSLYKDFTVLKKNGATRKLSRPNKQLAVVQKIILQKILEKIKWREQIFGFIKSKSHLENARQHLRSRFLINVDIEDFFPSINFYQVRSAFRNLGYSGEISTVLALLTTKSKQREVNFKGTKFISFSNDRSLPQGACTSPLISNLVFQKVDEQLIRRITNFQANYSRYADDMTFSFNQKNMVKPLLYMISKTLESYGYQLNRKKTRILSINNRMEVTGFVINSGNIRIPRKWRRQLRAEIHQLKSALTDQLNPSASTLGKINYLKISHPQTTRKYIEDLNINF